MPKKVEKKQNIFVRFLKKVLDPTQYTSIKSLAMLSSIVIAFCLSVCLGYAMIADVVIDGILNMNLIEAGIFVTCLGSFMGLASIPKVIIDRMRASQGYPYMPQEDIDREDIELEQAED